MIRALASDFTFDTAMAKSFDRQIDEGSNSMSIYTEGKNIQYIIEAINRYRNFQRPDMSLYEIAHVPPVPIINVPARNDHRLDLGIFDCRRWLVRPEYGQLYTKFTVTTSQRRSSPERTCEFEGCNAQLEIRGHGG